MTLSEWMMFIKQEICCNGVLFDSVRTVKQSCRARISANHNLSLSGLWSHIIRGGDLNFRLGLAAIFCVLYVGAGFHYSTTEYIRHGGVYFD